MIDKLQSSACSGSARDESAPGMQNIDDEDGSSAAEVGEISVTIPENLKLKNCTIPMPTIQSNLPRVGNMLTEIAQIDRDLDILAGQGQNKNVSIDNSSQDLGINYDDAMKMVYTPIKLKEKPKVVPSQCDSSRSTTAKERSSGARSVARPASTLRTGSRLTATRASS